MSRIVPAWPAAAWSAAVLWAVLPGAALCAQDAPRAGVAASPVTSVSPAAVIPEVSFTFDRVGLPVPRMVLRIDRNGAGSYEGDEMPPAFGHAAAAATPVPFRRALTVSSATADRIFTLAHELNWFHTRCASSAKNIANTGNKTLTYQAPDGAGTCSYNFSENKYVQQMTEIFQGIAETMNQGRELDRLHRYDRLGLDAALELLAGEVSAGRALELGTIAPSLRAIAADTEIMQRARVRADALLAMVPAETEQASRPPR